MKLMAMKPLQVRRTPAALLHLCGVLSLTLAACTTLTRPSFAQQSATESGQAIDGKELFAVCGFCHGMQGQGGPALDAPPLAGMEAWYVEKQLNSFRNRTRGMHPDDVPGLQMSIVSGMARNAATIANVAAYIESMPPGAPPELARGDVEAGTARPFIWRSKYAKLEHPQPADVDRGEEIYSSTCVACHSADGRGDEELGAPNLTDQADWYMHRQLQYFRDGIRGNDPNDTYGVEMAVFARTLADEQAIADVVAYIGSLQVAK